MNTKTIFLLFILQSQDHIIHYVTKSIFGRYKRYVTYEDIKKETILYYDILNIKYPLDNKDSDIKKLFSSVSRYARNERKNGRIYYSDDKYQLKSIHKPFEMNEMDEMRSYFHTLNDQEKNICYYIEKRYPLLDILLLEKLSFQQFQKIKKNCKRKFQNMDLYSQKDFCHDLIQYFLK